MKKIKLIIAFTFILGMAFINTTNAQTLIDCPNPLDIHIANDISGSVSSLEHQQSKEFITQLGLSIPLGTGANESRVGISQWSAGSGRFVEYAFPGAGATFTTSQADIVSYVNSARPFGGGTDTYTALLRAYDWVKQDRAGIRTGQPVIILLTDASCSQISNNISSLATQIKSEGILIQVLAIDDAVSCTALQGTNVASPGGYFAAADYATLQIDALFYITNLIANSCGTPPFPSVPDLTVNLSGFHITDCDTTPVADVDYTVINEGRGDFSGTLDVSFYNGDPTLPTTQYLFTESSTQTLTAFGGSTSVLNSANATLLDTGELYAVVNIDGSLPANAVPLSANFTGVSLTDTTEENTANNISNAVVRADAGTCLPYANIQTSVTNSGQICDNEAIYYVEVCNTGTADAEIVGIVPYPPAEFNLVNGPVLVGDDPFVGNTLPQGECVIYEYTYNLNNAVAGTTYNFSVDVKEPLCPNQSPTAVVEVNAGGHTWMDRNLGASRAAQSSTDFEAYGNLYQWGRGNDGHQCINWVSSTASDGTEQNNESTAQSTSPNPGSTFIVIDLGNWYIGTNPNDLWKPDLTGVNNPCPAGFRVPSETELTDLGITDASTAFTSISLPLAGARRTSNGGLTDVGFAGYYWSSSVSVPPPGARVIYFDNEDGFGQSFVYSAFRSLGTTIRCVKD